MGFVFDIQKYSTTNGPGIRTTAFFKGCPLRCLWCHNPESNELVPQLMYNVRLCTHCKTCVYACPNNAHTDDGISHGYLRSSCTLCGNCVDSCPNGALKVAGEDMSVIALVSRLIEDIKFYQHSNGGVTLSGGEPTMQYNFCLDVLKQLKQYKIHTALDTCGYCSEDKFQLLMPFVDLYLYDIKIVDSDLHKKYTGQPNKLILSNFENIIKKGKQVRVRVPLIPGYTDTDNNISDITYLLKLYHIKDVDLSFYHDLGVNKWRQLFKDYPIGITNYTNEQKKYLINQFNKNGIDTIIA